MSIIGSWNATWSNPLFPVAGVPVDVVLAGSQFIVEAIKGDNFVNVTFVDNRTGATVTGSIGMRNSESIAGQMSDPQAAPKSSVVYYVSAQCVQINGVETISGFVMHHDPATQDSGGQWGGAH